jgi:hypothetical protein
MDESRIFSVFTEMCLPQNCKEFVNDLLDVKATSRRQSYKSKTYDAEQLTNVNKTKLSIDLSDLNSSDFKYTHSVMSKDELGERYNVDGLETRKKKKKLDRGNT